MCCNRMKPLPESTTQDVEVRFGCTSLHNPGIKLKKTALTLACFLHDFRLQMSANPPRSSTPHSTWPRGTTTTTLWPAVRQSSTNKTLLDLATSRRLLLKSRECRFFPAPKIQSQQQDSGAAFEESANCSAVLPTKVSSQTSEGTGVILKTYFWEVCENFRWVRIFGMQTGDSLRLFHLPKNCSRPVGYL